MVDSATIPGEGGDIRPAVTARGDDVVARSFRLVQLVVAAGESVGVRELARRSGLPRSTVSRLVRTLSDLGVLTRTADAALLPGPALATLQPDGSPAVLQRVQPLLFELVARYGENAALSSDDGDELLYLSQVSGDHAVSAPDVSGERHPFHLVAPGLVTMAWWPAQRLTTWFDVGPVHDDAAVDIDDLRDRLTEIRRQGWCWTDQELEEGVNGLAVPVIHDGRLLATVSLYGPAYRFNPIQRPELAEELASLVRQRLDSLLPFATRDGLTGLLSRSAFMEALDQRVADHGDGLLLLYDIDGFKAVNDAFGRPTGDAVLVEAARRVVAGLPTHATVGRLGGDEFAAILPRDVDTEAVIDQVIEAIGRSIEVGDNAIYIAASVGWTDLRPGVESRTLLAEADAAMSESKRSPALSRAASNLPVRRELQRSLDLRRRFRAAVMGRQIVFDAQPIIATADARPIAVELLARWSPQSGPAIAPDEFNRLAHETGLAVDLDRLALAEAARLLADWRDDPVLHGVTVKANVSPLHVEQIELARSIHEVIPATDRHRLGLEFVETELLSANQRVLALLTDLAAMGVTLSIDDFGTGYSSLAYLRNLPVSEVKIDRSFITDIDTDDINRGLVRAIIEIAGTLGLSTIAEGVEHDRELAVLRSLGIGAVQGFLTGRPTPTGVVGDALRVALVSESG